MSEILDYIPEDAMITDKKIQYNSQYNKDRTTTVNVRLNYATDADLLRNLESVPNKQGLIKDLLRQYFDTKAPNEEQ